METKETLLKENPWRVLAEKIEKNGYMRLEKLNAYADDIPFIEEFNDGAGSPRDQGTDSG